MAAMDSAWQSSAYVERVDTWAKPGWRAEVLQIEALCHRRTLNSRCVAGFNRCPTNRRFDAQRSKVMAYAVGVWVLPRLKRQADELVKAVAVFRLAETPASPA